MLIPALTVVFALIPGLAGWTIQTNKSKIYGAQVGKGILQYVGIPYAKPPLGELRFAKPQPAPDADVIAANFKPACLQYAEKPYPPWYSPRDPPPPDAPDYVQKNYKRYNYYKKDPLQSEDCLYLNVFAPEKAVAPMYVDNSNVPAKVYIHGGGWFEYGSARMPYYEGWGDTAAENGFIVITVQYRLGALGFLTSGTEDAPGNVGLYDIAMALDWVNRNIEFFGGDVNQVTVEGQGAGAVALSLLQTSPGMIPDKFKVVLHSGSLLTLKALPGVDAKGDAFDNNLRLTDLLAKEVGCETSVKDKPSDTVKCLRGVNATLLVDTMASLFPTHGLPDAFLPQIRGGLFPRDPFEVLARDSLARDGFASFVSEEGSHHLTSAFPNVFGLLGENDVPLSAGCARNAARKVLQKFPASVVNSLLRNLDEEASECNRKKVVRAIGDAYVYCPTVYYAEQMKRGGSSNKFYMLEKQIYPAPYNPFAEWMGTVHFSNVQTDFLGYGVVWYMDKDGEFTGKRLSDGQKKQALNNHKLIKAFMSSQALNISEFTAETPAYNLMNSNGTFCVGKTKYHRRNCDILRPYFEYKDQ